MTVAVIGAGSWGTALAEVLASKGTKTILWARSSEVANYINDNHRNPVYLKDCDLDPSLISTTDKAYAIDDAEAIVVATPSQYARTTLEGFADLIKEHIPVVICSKGIEEDTGKLMTDVVADVIGNPERIAVLSGPTHAEEVVLKQPSVCVIASNSDTTATYFQDLFSTRKFRTYTSEDPSGVEICGAFKNVIAIATGISYGMGYGDNTAAALITRGLAEMGRMVVAHGGNPLTCMGLAGTGDMIVTCMSRHSRNRRFGEDYVAKGKTLADFYDDTHMVVEGAVACRTLHPLAEQLGVELPLTDAVRRIVWEGGDKTELAAMLFNRPLTTEFHGMSK